jgi:hypothetical protein
MLACDLAYFDVHTRLCVVGVNTRLMVPSLPVQRREMMVVAHLRDQGQSDRISIDFAVSTPSGQWIEASNADGLHIEMTDEYILATLRDLPFSDEGVYRFALYVDQESVAVLELPVLVSSTHGVAVCH